MVVAILGRDQYINTPGKGPSFHTGLLFMIEAPFAIFIKFIPIVWL